MTTTRFVELKRVKQLVGLGDVLGHYGLLEALQDKGKGQLVGRCPIHDGKSPKSFSANTGKNGFQCFSCKASGNQLDFVAAMEGFEGQGRWRDAGALVEEWFPERFGDSGAPAKPSGTPTDTESRSVAEEDDVENDSSELEVNVPLRFSLQLEEDHQYLIDRGLSPETIARFGIGYCGRGSMKGRIAIPLHDGSGEHVLAYAGRWCDTEEPLNGEGKYKLPPGDKFRKSLEVYNLHRVAADCKEVIVVEGYFSVYWLTQNGFPNVVSLMGSSLSEQQAELLATRFAGVRLFLDGDDAGRKAAETIALSLARRTWVRISECPEGLQPDQLPNHVLRQALK